MTEVLLTIVAEAPLDATVVKRLVERAADELRDPTEAELVGPDPTFAPPFIKWAYLPKLLQQHAVKPWHGHFNGKPGLPDSTAAANALRLIRQWMKDGARTDVVILQRDFDKQPERREGLRQGRDAVPLDVPVLIGGADPKVEAWAICAFEPNDPETHDRLKTVRKMLGFDPREKSHELDASEAGAKRNVKRVLEELLGEGDTAFAALCKSTPLATLHERGVTNGLTEFLAAATAMLKAVSANKRPPAAPA